MGDRKRCWDCVRRRLVCDLGRPACNRCQTVGLSCSGYGDKKPVQFLEPGVVLSRPRKGKDGANRAGRLNGGALTKINRTKQAELQASYTHVVGPKCSMRVQYSARAEHGHQLPTCNKLRMDVEDIVEAITYWDSATQSWFADSQFRSNPFSTPLQGHVHLLPSSYQHCLTVLALNHRMYHLSVRSQHGEAYALRLRQHDHTDHALKLIREGINGAATTDNLVMVASIMLFNKIELMYSELVDWRGHIKAFVSLAKSGGGLQKLFKEDARFRFSILTIMITNIVANTTSPATNQYLTDYYFKHIAWVSKVYSICDYPPFPCPQELFLQIVRINYLRSQRRNHQCDSLGTTTLDQIEAFSPERWACSKADQHYDSWLAFARMYQSAVLLYAASTVASIAPLQSEVHRKRLLELLEVASHSVHSIYSVMWPIMVAGATLEKSDLLGRRIVRDCLLRLSLEGNYRLPHRAYDMLERFWASNRTAWDDAFDKPYMFLI